MFASLALLMSAAADPAALAAHCRGKDGWEEPAPSARIFGDTYYVGTCGIAAILIAGPEGHVLIDAGPEGAAPLVAANIEALGYRVEDVRLILNSHEHHDHAGGIAELQRRSGATVAVRAPALGPFRTGRSEPGDPQHGSLDPMPAVANVRTVADGETIVLGPIRVTAHATPGHTPGGTSWTWRSCDSVTCFNLAYADSLTAISAEGFRFSTSPAYVEAFRQGIARVAVLPCDILLTPHPGASGLFDRIESGALSQPGACEAYAKRGAARLDARLAREQE